MTHLPSVGAHIVLLGAGAFEGSVRQVIYATQSLTNNVIRAAIAQEKAGQDSASATAKSAALTAAAYEAEAKAVAAAKNAEAASVRAANDKILADNARVIAAQAAQQAEGLASIKPGAINMLGAANKGLPSAAAATAAQAAQQASALQAVATASAQAAQAAQNMAATTAAASKTAAAAVTNFGTAATGAANTTAASFTAMSGVVIGVFIAIAAAIGLAIGAMIAWGVQAIKLGNEYATAMNTVQTLTGETNSKMSELNDVILRIGTTTQSSMQQAAQATAELAKGGVSLDDAMSGALDAVVNLSAASAGELELAAAAKAVANGMAAFNLHGAESVKVADAITGVAQSTTATYNDLAHSLQQVGTVANNLNYSIGDTYTAIGLLSLNAIKGSDAGTALRTMFQHLQNPSKQAAKLLNEFGVSLYDSAGKARPLRDVVINLEKAFGEQAIASKKLTEARRDDALATIFSTDGMRAALSLINQGVEGYDKLAESQRNLTAADVAGKMILPLNAQLAILGNNLNAISVQFGGAFEPALQKVTGSALALVHGIAMNTSALTLFGNTVSALATGAGFDALYTQITNVFGADLGNKIIEFVNLFRNIGDAIGEFILPAFNAVGEAVSGLFTDTGNIDAFAGLMQTAAEGARIFAMVIGGVINVVAGLINAFGSLPADVRNVAGAFALMLTPLGPLIAAFTVLPQLVNATLSALIDLPPIGAAIGSSFSGLGEIIQAGLAGAGAVFGALAEQAGMFASTVGGAIEATISALAPLEPALVIIIAPMAAIIAISILLGEAIVNAVGAAVAAFAEFSSAAESAGEGFDTLVSDTETASADVSNVLTGLGEFIGNLFNAIGMFIQESWTDTWTWVVNFFNAVAAALVAAHNGLGEAIAMIFNAIGTAIHTIWGATWEGTVETVKSAVIALVNNVAVLGNSISAAFSSAGTAIGNVWHRVWSGIQTILVSALNALASKLNGFFEMLKASPVGQFVEGAIGGFTQLGESAIASMGALGEKVDEIQGNIKGSLESLQSSIRATSGAFQGIQFAVPAAPAGGGGLGRGTVPGAGGGGGGTTPSTDAGKYPIEGGGKSDEEKAAEKAAKDAAEALKRLEELYQDTMRKLQNLVDDTGQKIADAWEKHQEATYKASEANAKKLLELERKKNEDILKENEKFENKDVRENLTKALQDEIDLERTARQRRLEDIETGHQRELDAIRRARQERRDLLETANQQEEEDQERAIKRGIENIDRGVQRANAAMQRGLQEQQQMQSRALSEMFEMQNAARQEQYSAEDAAIARARDAAHQSAQMSRDLAQAKTPEERQRVMQQAQERAAENAVKAAEAQADLQRAAARKQADMATKKAQQGAEDALKRQQQAQSTGLGYSQEDADTKRRQGQEDADLKRQRDNATKLRDNRLKLDAEERKIREGEDDAETKRKRGLDDTERDVRKTEDARIRQQKNDFELEDHNTRLANIESEYAREYAEEVQSHIDKQAEIDKSLAKELEKIQETYEKARRAIVQAWEDAWQELINKSPAVIEELDALFGSFMESVAATDAMVKNLIQDLLNAIALGDKLEGGESTQGSTAAAEDESTPQSAPEPAGLPDFAHGGIVKGPWGSPQQVTAHGGEVYLGLQNQMAKYMPTAAALATLGSATPTIVNNSTVTNVTYSVNASYANQQSPASVSMDLQALGAMARR